MQISYIRFDRKLNILRPTTNTIVQPAIKDLMHTINLSSNIFHIDVTEKQLKDKNITLYTKVSKDDISLTTIFFFHFINRAWIHWMYRMINSWNICALTYWCFLKESCTYYGFTFQKCLTWINLSIPQFPLGIKTLQILKNYVVSLFPKGCANMNMIANSYSPNLHPIKLTFCETMTDYILYLLLGI